MRRILVLGLLASFACSAEGGGVEKAAEKPIDPPAEKPIEKPIEPPIEPPAEKPIEPPVEKPIEPPIDQLPEHMGNEVVTISTTLAKSNNLPPLGFSLDFTGTAFTVSPFSNGGYLHAGGPPGGPLSLSLSAVARDADLAKVVQSRHEEAKPVAESIDLLGAKHGAVAWATGKGFGESSWCAFILAPPAGDDALLVELQVGHTVDEVRCSIALGHDELAKVIASFSWQ